MVDNPATAQQTAEQIESQADFGRELTALRERAGLRIRDVGRLSGIPVSTVGDYFSGRHLPADRQQLIRILEVCGETDPARIAWWEAALQRVRRLPGRRTGTPYRGLARFEQQDARWFFGREDVTEHLVALAAESSALPLVLVGPSGAGKSSLLRAGLLPRLQRAGRGSPGNRRAGDRARAHGHPGRRPQGPARGARGRPGGRRRRTPGGHRGPVRGGLHPVPRRGAAPRLHHRAVRTGRDRAGDPGAAGRLLRPGDPLPGAGERAAVPAGRTQSDDSGPGPPCRHRARPAGQGGRRRRPCRAAARRPVAAGRGRAHRERRRTRCHRRTRRPRRTRRRVRAGRAAAAVARHAGHLGTQPGRHAGDRRLPGERRDQGRPHPDGRARLRQPDAGPAAARQAAVPSPGARGR